MSGFTHDIASGAGNLIVNQIQSPNYVADEAGWQISKSGAAQFNDLTVRGQIFVEGNDDGIFVYAYFPITM